MALVLEALGVGQHPRHQAAHRVRPRHGGDLPPGEHEIPQGDLLVHALVDEPLVDALVVAAHQDQAVVLPGQPLGVRLGEGFAAGGQVDGMGPPRPLPAEVVPAAEQGVGLEHRPPPPAVGVVVHLLLFVHRVIPELVGGNTQEVPLLSPAQDGLGQHVPHRVGEQGDDINAVHKLSLPSSARHLRL